MDGEQRLIEALKLIVDWTKWMATVEVGALAVIASLFKVENKASWSPVAQEALILTAGSFVIALVVASATILSAVELAQLGDPKKNVWTTRDSVVPLSLQTLGFIQAVCFV